MSELLSTLTRLFTLIFVVSSMFSFGLRLTPRQIIEPLRDARLVILSLAVNFVIVPLAALLLASVFDLHDDLRTGLILISTVAGAAFTPKLAQIAKGDIPFAVSLTALLLLATVVFQPLVLPLLLPGVQVDALGIFKSLSVQTLVPLALGLLVNSLWDEESEALLPPLGQIANTSLALMLALQLGLGLRDVLGLLGTGAILAILLVLVIAMVAGYFLGGPDAARRRTLAVGSGQRNLAAALVVGTSNFASRPDVIIVVTAAGLIAMVLVIPVAGQLGKQSKRAGASVFAQPATADGDRAER